MNLRLRLALCLPLAFASTFALAQEYLFDILAKPSLCRTVDWSGRNLCASSEACHKAQLRFPLSHAYPSAIHRMLRRIDPCPSVYGW